MTELFSEYGTIVDIIAKTNLKAKGQAFIVFDNVESATNAIEEINGFELFEKPMTLDYAKTRSDATVVPWRSVTPARRAAPEKACAVW